eukprot:6315027-Prymnesium_polylepis.1
MGGLVLLLSLAVCGGAVFVLSSLRSLRFKPSAPRVPPPVVHAPPVPPCTPCASAPWFGPSALVYGLSASGSNRGCIAIASGVPPPGARSQRQPALSFAARACTPLVLVCVQRAMTPTRRSSSGEPLRPRQSPPVASA